MAPKKNAKKSTAKTPTATATKQPKSRTLNKAAEIRKLGLAMPVKEVIATLAARGIKVVPQQVYSARKVKAQAKVSAPKPPPAPKVAKVVTSKRGSKLLITKDERGTIIAPAPFEVTHQQADEAAALLIVAMGPQGAKNHLEFIAGRIARGRAV